jgi:GH35 family endo-1,4-beta-xylanase
MKILYFISNLPCLVLLLFSTCTKSTNYVDSPPVIQIIPPDTIKELTLKEINPNVLIGSPIEMDFDNDKYKGIIKSEFSTGQSLWYARWNGWDEEKKYNFTNLNNNINWMIQNGLSPMVHMMVGQDTYAPDWLINGKWEVPKLDSLLHGLVDTIMDSNDNKNKVDVWNVANELFDDDGFYRKNIVWNQIGWEVDSSQLTGIEKINKKHPLFIRKVFTYCRNKTKNKLELRDFNIESNNPIHDNNDKRQKAVYQLLKHMLNTNIPIDALGIQGHLLVGQSEWRLEDNTLKNTVEKFKALGIEVYLTEIDAGFENRTWSPKLAEEQKQDYYQYIKQGIQGGVSRIYFWGIQDGMDKGWLTNQHPLPWDENLNKKPAYYGVKQALMDTKK